MDFHAAGAGAGLDAARHRVATGAAAPTARGWPAWPHQQLGDRRCALPPCPPPPPPPRAAEGRRGRGGAREAGDTWRGSGARKAGEAGGGGARRGLALAGPHADKAGGNEAAAVPAGDGAAGVVVVAAPREGSVGGEVVGRKRPFAMQAPRAYPPPKRRLVSATRRYPPGCGRGADGGSRLVAARPDGGSAALPEPAAAPPPPVSVVEAGSGVLAKVSAAVVSGSIADGSHHDPDAGVLRSSEPSRQSGVAAAAPPLSVGKARSGVPAKVSAAIVSGPIVDGGGHGPDAGTVRSPQPSRQSSVAAADGLLDSDSQGGPGNGGFGSGKKLVPATRLLPRPGMVSAIRRFPPGCGRVTTNGIEETDELTEYLVAQSLKPAEKCPRTESKELAAARGSFGPKKKAIVKGPAHLRMKVASACTAGTINKLDDMAASIVEDDGFLKALAAYERKLELKLNISSDIPSVKCQRQDGTQNPGARNEVKMMCKRFQFICGAIVQVVEQRSLKISRIDLVADKVIRKLPEFTQHGPIVGNVPGVEIGDEFVYRVELALVGIHRPYQGGIDTTRDENGVLIAISIVASGGYPDELSSSGELVYTGSGGKFAGKKNDENQKLKRGNLALKNCIQTKTPVRVIHGFKCLSREEGSHSRAKGASAFTYDGLYHVVSCWREGQAGSKVFKYKLQRIAGQPELPQYSKTAHSSKTGIMC